jgi:hopene-associated glycosyltransferase HpnB
MVHDTLFAVTLLSLAGWVYLLCGRGSFWRANQRLPPHPEAPRNWPKVAAVIPARNEADCVGLAVRSLLGQDYDGDLRIIVVDDNSSDGTAAAAQHAAAGDPRLTVLSGAPLARRWTGKLWAVHQGIESVLSASPDTEFLLLTDADIEHDPGNLARLVAWAQATRSDLVSLMVRLRCKTFWESLLVPPFVFFFQKLYPFSWVNDRGRRTAAAAGGCMLVCCGSLQSAGGIPEVRGELIDDCALAVRIKQHGGAIWLGLSEETRSLRRYRQLRNIWSMVARTAFTHLNHSVARLASTVAGMLLLYLTPPLAVLHWLVGGSLDVAALGAVSWILMAVSFLPTLALYRHSPAWALLLPIAGCLYVLMTVDSARLSWQGRGGLWKGRSVEADLVADPNPDTGALTDPVRQQ